MVIGIPAPEISSEPEDIIPPVHPVFKTGKEFSGQFITGICCHYDPEDHAQCGVGVAPEAECFDDGPGRIA